MKTITVFCERLHAAKVNPEKFVAQVKDWEASGYRVNFQIPDEGSLTFMQGIVAAEKEPAPSSELFPYAGLFLLGIISGLITISVGWIGLLR